MSNLELLPGQAHIWLTPLEVIENPDRTPADASLFEALEAILCDAEKTRSKRFAFENNRREYVAAHALCRTMLSAFSKTRPRDWRFETGPYGRPEIAGPEAAGKLRFNISHTRGLVCVALTLGADIGVDVERKDRNNQLEEIARAKFSKSEAAQLAGLRESEKREVFFSIWTLKEAYIKAIGKGLREPLDGFAFSLDPLAIKFLQDQDDPQAWCFDLFQPAPGYLCSLAAKSGRKRGLSVTRRSLDTAELSGLIGS